MTQGGHQPMLNNVFSELTPGPFPGQVCSAYGQFMHEALLDFDLRKAHIRADRNASSKRPDLHILTIGPPSGVSVNLAPKHVGRKETLCNYLQSSKESRSLVLRKEPSRAFSQQLSSASDGADRRSEILPRKWLSKAPKTQLCRCLRQSASISSSTPPRPRRPWPN